MDFIKKVLAMDEVVQNLNESLEEYAKKIEIEKLRAIGEVILYFYSIRGIKLKLNRIIGKRNWWNFQIFWMRRKQNMRDIKLNWMH